MNQYILDGMSLELCFGLRIVRCGIRFIGPPQVVRMEIRSRMSATNKLKEAMNNLKAESREQAKALSSSIEERLQRMERKLEVLLSAERKLYARQTDLEAGVRSYEGLVTDAVAELRDEVEEAVVNQVLGEVVLKEDMLAQLDGGWDVIRDSLGAEFRGELRNVQAAAEADLTDALEAIEEDAAVFQEEVQGQLTELAKQRTEDIGLLQHVAGEMVRCRNAVALDARRGSPPLLEACVPLASSEGVVCPGVSPLLAQRLTPLTCLTGAPQRSSERRDRGTADSAG